MAMPGNFEKPPIMENPPEEMSKATPEMAAEQIFQPEGLEAVIVCDEMNQDLIRLKIKQEKGELTEEERELLEILQEDMDGLGEDFEIEEIIEK